MNTNDYSQWFRGSTPYISAHRGKTFVVYLGGEALAHANITNIIHDLALLHVLGVQLVLVHGGRPQLDKALPNSKTHNHRRITEPGDMDKVTGVYGLLRSHLEGLFSTGLPNTPLHNVDISVVSGNFVTAKPLGVLDGIDHLLTGQLRSLDSARIRDLLSAANLVLQSPLGFSNSGQAFNLASEELAADISIALQADKLIFFDEIEHLKTSQSQRQSTITPSTLDDFLADLSLGSAQRYLAMSRAVRAGVTKAHQISYVHDGGLLQELFTAEGVGTQLVEEQRHPVRAAVLADVGDIVEIIRPLLSGHVPGCSGRGDEGPSDFLCARRWPAAGTVHRRRCRDSAGRRTASPGASGSTCRRRRHCGDHSTTGREWRPSQAFP